MYRSLRWLLILVFAISTSPSGHSQVDSIAPHHLELMMDSIILSHMETYKVPGVSYTIVKDDRIIALKAHGMANIAKGEFMNPDHKFMLGSLSKLITATAVMQLEEKGMVGLDVDINQYLKAFKLSKKVTLRQLLTHTAGFEEKGFDRIRLKSRDLLSLEDYLKLKMPHIIFPPGDIPAYSNHGVALAGYIVQIVSGQPFEEYAKDHIFLPLEMESASFSLGDNSQPEFATPYLLDDNELVETRLEYVQTIPASMLTGSARDMAHFMMAHLNGGQYKSKRILQQKTTDEMQSTQYTPHDSLHGRCLGFFESWHGDLRGLVHGNTRNGYVSYLYLMPDHKLGIFITLNGGRGQFRNVVINDLLETIYSLKETRPSVNSSVKSSSEDDLRKYEGEYISARRNESTIEALFHYISPVNKVDVSVQSDSSLTFFGREFVNKSNQLFIDKADNIPAYIRYLNGTTTIFFGGRSDAYTKLPWNKTRSAILGIFILAIIVFLVQLIAYGRKRFLGKKNEIDLMNRIQSWFSITSLSFIVLFGLSIGIIQEDMQNGIPWFFYLIFTLPVISIALYFLWIIHLGRQWRNSVKWIIYHLFFAVISLLYIWQLHVWNFIGYQF